MTQSKSRSGPLTRTKTSDDAITQPVRSAAPRGVLTLAATLVATAGAIASLPSVAVAQDAGQGSRQEAQEERDSPLRRIWGGIRPGGAAEQQPQAQPQQPRQRQTAQPTPDAREEIRREDLNEDIVRLDRFTDAVRLGVLIDWVADQLGVNIFSPETLDAQSVVFNGPLEIPRDELLTLLDLLVQQQGYALTREREGWYTIRPVAEVAPSLGPERLSTSRVIDTDLLRPSALQDAIDKTLGTGSGGVRIAYVDELGVMLVTGAPRAIDSVQAVVDAMLEQRNRQQLHRFELTHLSADVALQRILQLRAPGSSSNASAATRVVNTPTGDTRPQQQQPTTTGAGGGLSNLPEQLLTDPASNSIIFRGTLREAASLLELIEIIDVPSRLVAERYAVGPAAPQIAAFGERNGLGPVSTISLGQTASSFGGQQFGTRQFGNQFNQRGAFGQQQNQPQQGGAGFVLEDNGEAFTYFGTRAQHEQVRQLVDAFAEQAMNARIIVEFYRLNHADAESVAELLNEIVQDPQSRTGESPFLPGAGFGNQVRRPQPVIVNGREVDLNAPPTEGGEGMGLTRNEEITIVADIARNQIAVGAPLRQQKEIARIIQKLDVRRPQVFVEVQIVSVTTSRDFQFAIESQLTPGQGVLFTNFGLTTAPQGGSATDPRQVATGLRGLTAAVIKSDMVPIVINAFQENGDTRIVSSPRLLVNDNEEATVESKRVEPFAQTNQTDSSTITSQGGESEAGTLLTITPQISDAGQLNLTYSLELSDFDRSAAQTNGLAPPRQVEKFDGIVTLPSDATMVVGGLTRERMSRTVQGVPFLMDIPVLGELFKRTGEDNAQATIYVFITPRIVRDPTFADLRLITEGPAKASEIDQILPSLEPALMSIHGSPKALMPARQDQPPPALMPIEEEDAAGPAMAPISLDNDRPSRTDAPGAQRALVIAREDERRENGGAGR